MALRTPKNTQPLTSSFTNDGPILGAPGQMPGVTTNAETNIGTTSAQCNGIVTTWNYPGQTKLTQGFYWSDVHTTPTSADSSVDLGTTLDTFSYVITGLTQSTTYYVRAYAVNTGGEGAGFAIQFDTTAPPMDIGQRISADISAQDTLLAAAVSSDIIAQTSTLFSALSSDLTTQDNSFAAQISTQFANRHIV